MELPKEITVRLNGISGFLEWSSSSQSKSAAFHLFRPGSLPALTLLFMGFSSPSEGHSRYPGEQGWLCVSSAYKTSRESIILITFSCHHHSPHTMPENGPNPPLQQWTKSAKITFPASLPALFRFIPGKSTTGQAEREQGEHRRADDDSFSSKSLIECVELIKSGLGELDPGRAGPNVQQPTSAGSSKL